MTSRTTDHEVPGATLSVHDSGGAGAPLVLLHGLGGYAGEWQPLAAHLPEARLITVDQRGHGASTTRPTDVSRDAFVADVASIIDSAGVGPVTLVGQSMGAHTALLVAAAHPQLVSRLVLVEGGVGGEGGDASDEVIDWFRSWPAPFADAESAASYFGGGVAGETWTAGLARTPQGLVPRFDPDVLHEAISAVHARARWDEWATIRCPVLLVKGEEGFLPQEEADQMLATNSHAELVTIPGAGHDVHLDASEELAQAITGGRTVWP